MDSTNRSAGWGLLVAGAWVAIVFAALAMIPHHEAPTTPETPALPVAPDKDKSCPDCKPKPSDPAPRPCPLRPWGPRMVAVGDPEPQIDLLALPGASRPRNVGGTDGAGLCVFTSIQYAAWWQNESRLFEFQKQMRGERGGGWPDKVDQMVAKYAPGVRYAQYRGKDPAILELALRTGRVPCVTWQGNHMLCLVHLDAERAAIVDNNAPEKVQWLSRATFLSKWVQGGSGWAVVLLNPPPPPPPRNTDGKKALARRSQSCVCGCECPVCGCEPCRCGPVASPLVITPGLESSGVVISAGWSGWFSGYRIDGLPVDERIAKDALADDSAKNHLTLIGAPEMRKAALQELELGETQALRLALVQEYSPTDWAVGCGFCVSGKLQVYYQSRSGKVLFRGEGVGNLTRSLTEALRKSDPDYDPKKDPGGSVPKAPLSLPFDVKREQITWCCGGAGVGALALYALLRRRQTGQQPLPPVAVPAPVAVQSSDAQRINGLAQRLVERQMEQMLRQLEQGQPEVKK